MCRIATSSRRFWQLRANAFHHSRVPLPIQGKLTADEVQQQAGIPLEIVKRSDIAKGFHILPKRWIVERTYGWLGRCRRIVKDYENLTRSHIGFIILAMIRLMLRRIVRLATSK